MGDVPVCDSGPCGFRIESTAKATYRFRYDSALGDYRAVLTETHPCPDATDGGEYELRGEFTLNVVRAVKTDGGRFASEMFGTREATAAVPAGAACGELDGASQEDSVRVVRIDPPAGAQKPYGPGERP